jgi:hypothetical protein
VAQEIIAIMDQAGVKFYCTDGKTQRKSPVRVDFERMIEEDTLISHPPESVALTGQ